MPISRRRRLACLLALIPLPLAALVGCASTRAASNDPLAAVPGDLTINVAIVAGADAPDRSEAHLRQGRFIVFADGSLHYGAHDSYPVRWMPPYVRELSRPQMAALWNDIVNTGLGRPEAGTLPVNMHLLDAPDKGVLYMVELTADGRSWQFIDPVMDPKTLNPAIRQLIRDLAALAWASEMPEDDFIAVPKRYDHGPDPYAQFRETDS